MFDTAASLAQMLIAALKAYPPGEIVRIATGDPAAPIAFGARVPIDGPPNPAYSGFLAISAFDSLKRLNANASSCAKTCHICVEPEGFFRTLSQWSFAQTVSSVIVCVVGDETGNEVVKSILLAAEQWGQGQYRLFDSDGYHHDDAAKVDVHVKMPNGKHRKALRLGKTFAEFIAIMYEVSHLFRR